MPGLRGRIVAFETSDRRKKTNYTAGSGKELLIEAHRNSDVEVTVHFETSVESALVANLADLPDLYAVRPYSNLNAEVGSSLIA